MKSLFTTTDSSDHRAFPGLQEKLSAAIEQLKARLQLRYEQCLPRKSEQIREVVRTAESAAWLTPFPHLFLPELADEGIARLVATQAVNFANKSARLAHAA